MSLSNGRYARGNSDRGPCRHLGAAYLRRGGVAARAAAAAAATAAAATAAATAAAAPTCDISAVTTTATAAISTGSRRFLVQDVAELDFSGVHFSDFLS